MSFGVGASTCYCVLFLCACALFYSTPHALEHIVIVRIIGATAGHTDAPSNQAAPDADGKRAATALPLQPSQSVESPPPPSARRHEAQPVHYVPVTSSPPSPSPTTTPSSSYSPPPSVLPAVSPAIDNAEDGERWRKPQQRRGPAVPGQLLPDCISLDAWDDSHFSAEQDWVPMVDGRREEGTTLWRWVDTGGSTKGHLRNRATNGHLNSRPGGFVRGHGNEDKPPRRPAPASQSTLLLRTPIDYGRYRLDDRPCTWGGTGGAGGGPRYATLQFTNLRGAGYLHVLQDGSLSADKAECSDDAACVFSFEPSTSAPGWMVVRSVLSGGLLRMVDDRHPPYDGWDGVSQPKASPKGSRELKQQRAAAEAAMSGRAECPLRRIGTRGSRPPPAGWAYNATAYASLVRRSVAPWYDGELSATAVDLGFWRDMYPYANRYERPTLHVALSGGDVRFKWQPAAPRKGEAAAVPAPGGGPPRASHDRGFLQMLSEVHARVKLPAVEFVAHTLPRPKVPAQNLELVLSPTADVAHNDIAVPSPWLYDTVADAATQTPLPSPAAVACRSARPQLCLIASCRGPVDGFRGPLWRYYTPHRAALLASEPPLRGRLRVSLAQPCVGPPLEDLPLEAAWSAKAAAELRAEASAETFRGDGALTAGEPCACPWELLVDEDGPPSRLVAALRRGALVFKQWSPYYEFFHVRLLPWIHYIPVADNLEDLAARVAWADANPKRVAEIAAAGQSVAASLNAYEISCFWWQLLTALAPLENFEPRSDARYMAAAKYLSRTK